MVNIYLVRHGKAFSNWGEALDPGLDGQGKRQAEDVVESFSLKDPVDIVSSPLLRARETALPLSKAWKIKPVIDVRVSEIPTPKEYIEARNQWLREVMQGK